MQPQRRSYSKSFKAQVIQECSEPGASIASVVQSLASESPLLTSQATIAQRNLVNAQTCLDGLIID